MAPGHERNLVVPDFAAHGGNGIAEGAMSFWIPGGGRGNQRRVGGKVMRPESNPVSYTHLDVYKRQHQQEKEAIMY